MQIEELGKEHFGALYDVVLRNEPFAPQLIQTRLHYDAAMQGVEGFVLLDADRLVGAVTFNKLIPLTDICLHAVIEKQYRLRWMTREIARRIAHYAFEELQLPRMSSYGIRDVTPQAEQALIKYGFRCEGVRERAILMPDGYHDIVMYGLLKERCRWL